MSFNTPRLVSVLICVLVCFTPGLAKEYDILIRGGHVIDGTGSEPKKLDVGIKGDRIDAVGDLKGDTAKKVINTSKYVVTLGLKGEPNHAKAGIVLRHEYKIRGNSTQFVSQTVSTIKNQGGTRIDGALVIAGGGGLPDAVFEEFIKLAGSADSHIVVIPTASTRADSGDSSDTIEIWKQRGASTVAVLHTRDRDVANKNEFIAPLKKATGVWFGGGSQSRITDVYLGTAVEGELWLLLKRGGVIGGSSAGAAIMTEVMIAGGNPIARTTKGFGFLPGAVADQHFLRRNRVNRLIGVLQDHPGLVGFGIDEGTAIVVTGSRVRAVGRSYVTVLVSASQQHALYVKMLEDGEEVDLSELSATAARRIKSTTADKTEGGVQNRPSSP
jgi:cyanophycinase